MNQRVFYGSMNPKDLADHLVQIFNQPHGMYYNQLHTMAQRVGDGDSVLVQILHTGPWSGHNNTLGVQIVRIPNGVSVSMGQSNWLDMNETTLAGMVVGALFFPPLLLFPLISGLTSSTFEQDVWSVIEGYCAWAARRSAGSEMPHFFYCPYCGAYNQSGARQCLNCNGPLYAAPPQSSPSPQAEPASSSGGQAQADVEEAPPASAAGVESVVCPQCGATVAAANFCGNCAAPLRQTKAPQE